MMQVREARDDARGGVDSPTTGCRTRRCEVTAKKGFKDYVWAVVLVLSLVLALWTVLVFAGGGFILDQSLQMAGSAMGRGDFDEAGLGFLTMAMRKPLWEEMWIGILGVYCAFGLKKKKKHTWTLGVFWGIMLMTNAAIQGGYEVLVLKWPSACLQTYLFLLLGAIAVVSLLFTRRGFFPYQDQLRRRS
jgi:hypothetical protein